MPPVWAPWTLFLVSILLVPALRFAAGSPPVPLDTSYTALLATHDPGFSPYLLVLGIAASFGLAWLLPGLLGILNFWLLGKILPKLMTGRRDARTERYALILFAISPLAIAVHTAHSPLVFCLLFTLIGFGAYLRRTLFGGLVAAASFVGLIMTAPLAGVLFAVPMGIRSLVKRRRALGSVLLVAAAFGILLIDAASLAAVLSASVQGAFGEFGGLFGYSIFVLLLAIIGVILTWSAIDRWQALIFLVFLGVSLFVEGLRPLAIVLLVLYAAHGVTELISRRWSVDLLRQASLLLLLCLGLFLAITNVRQLLHASPDDRFLQVLAPIATERDSGTVLSLQEHRGVIGYFTGRDTVTPPDAVLQAATVGQAVPWLVENGVQYVLITPGMTQGAPWRHDDEGLLFIIKHNEKFINISAVDGYELWLFLREYAPGPRPPDSG